MFIEILIAILLGVTAGTFTGLVPGIHTNLLSITIVSMSALILTTISPLHVALFIIGMSICHSFVNAVPATFLGAPDPDKSLTALPAHKMVLKGAGYDAIRLTLIGSLYCLLIGVLVSPLMYLFLKTQYDLLREYMFYLLGIAVCCTIFLDKRFIKNLFIFLLAGSVGYIALQSSFIKDPLFPLLSGMFGISLLITSLEQNVSIPKQHCKTSKISKKELYTALFGGSLAGGLTSFLPGLGSSQGAALIKKPLNHISEKGFLIVVGGIGTINFTLSIIAFIAIEKARNGSIIGISHFIPLFTAETVILFLLAAVISGTLSVMISLSLAKNIGKFISYLPYKTTVYIVIGFICIMTSILSNIYGILLLITSVSLGILTEKIGVAKTQLMGCLLFPTLLYFAPF